MNTDLEWLFFPHPLVYAPCWLCASALLWNSPGSMESRKHNSPARTPPLTNCSSWTNLLTLQPVPSHFTQSTWLQAPCQLWFYAPGLEFSKEVLQNWLEFPRSQLGNLAGDHGLVDEESPSESVATRFSLRTLQLSATHRQTHHHCRKGCLILPLFVLYAAKPKPQLAAPSLPILGPIWDPGYQGNKEKRPHCRGVHSMLHKTPVPRRWQWQGTHRTQVKCFPYLLGEVDRASWDNTKHWTIYLFKSSWHIKGILSFYFPL